MYVTRAEKHDRDITESWKIDTDGTLIFVRIFLCVEILTIEHFENTVL